MQRGPRTPPRGVIVGSLWSPIPCGVNFGRGRWCPRGRDEDAQPDPRSTPPQHFALFLKYIIQVAIPDIPAWVAEEMAKLEYQRREAFKVGDAGVGPSWGPSAEPGHPIPGAGGLPGVSPRRPQG